MDKNINVKECILLVLITYIHNNIYQKLEITENIKMLNKIILCTKPEIGVCPAADSKLQKWHKQRKDIYFFRSVQTDDGGHEPHIQLEKGCFLFRFYAPNNEPKN